MTVGLTAVSAGALAQPVTPPPASVRFYGNPTSPISAGVVIPADAVFIWTSGTVPPVADANAAPSDRVRFGDTRVQAAGVLKSIEAQLIAQGASLRDVVYLRAYLVPDPIKGGRIDMDGWSEAYKEVFGTAANPTRPARSTVGVAALVNPAWLIEIEAFAVLPKAEPRGSTPASPAR
jgi:enamine deaminase RidA (YjgF/YER057c/UK114 family)